MSRIKTFVSREGAPIRLGTLTRALSFLLVLAVLITAGALSQAQSNFTVIHAFTGPDGDEPNSSPTLDRQGNLYGTTLVGGLTGHGVVYELTHVSGSWILHPLHSFAGQSDGGNPYAGVTIGPDGTLFGTTYLDGASGYGTLFNLKPPAHIVCAPALCPWTEVILHSFAGGSDGATPLGNVVFDSQGNLYGTTAYGGTYNGGTVYKGVRSGGTWNVSVIHDFGASSNDGELPVGGLVFDSAGNLYGTTQNGGFYKLGTVFELSPSEGGWTETVLHSFSETDACGPDAGLVFDRAGNLYGATPADWTIFELSPQGSGWNFTTIYSSHGFEGPYSTLAIDAAGNLYGTVPYGGIHGYGTVWELSPSSGGGWTYTDLHDFTGGNDGEASVGGVAVTGPGGYLYGATTAGGAHSRGVIYQINLGAR